MRALRWSLIMAGCGALLLVLGVSTVRESYREWRVDQEIRDLQAQVEAFEHRKLELTEIIQRFQSAETLDREARLRLGLRKPGERVVILRDGGNAPAWNAPQNFSGPSEGAVSTSNLTKWFRYFFRIGNL